MMSGRKYLYNGATTKKQKELVENLLCTYDYIGIINTFLLPAPGLAIGWFKTYLKITNYYPAGGGLSGVERYYFVHC